MTKNRFKPRTFTKIKRSMNPFIERIIPVLIVDFVSLVAMIIWWMVSPYIFYEFLPTFALYNKWITNFGTTYDAVFQFWFLIPIFGLFFIALIWNIYEILSK